MRGLLESSAALAALLLPAVALAQDGAEPPAAEAEADRASPDGVTGDMPPPMPTDMPISDEPVDAERDPEARTASLSGAQVYTPADFARFAPRSALDMLG